MKESCGEVNSTWRQTRQSRRIHSADFQTPELRYLSPFESIQNLRRKSGVVVEADNCLLLRKKRDEAAAKVQNGGAHTLARYFNELPRSTFQSYQDLSYSTVLCSTVDTRTLVRNLVRDRRIC